MSLLKYLNLKAAALERTIMHSANILIKSIE